MPPLVLEQLVLGGVRIFASMRGPGAAGSEPRQRCYRPAKIEGPVGSHYYSQHAVALRAELGEALSRDIMRQLHRKSGWRHGLVAVRQFAMLAAATWGLIHFENPLIWIPLAVVQGFTVFNFTILLHEVVHHTVFDRRRPLAERVLGFLYAIPSGISPSQFTRWHLDHHAELGSDEDDPKRHHLSPKVNARWYKLLYCTPALFPIYFRAARRESVTYDAALQARDRRRAQDFDRRPPRGDRAGLVCRSASTRRCGRTSSRSSSSSRSPSRLNRLGQHYDIDPDGPGEVGHADARPLVLGFRVPELELPPRAPLLPGRAVLPAAGAAARARAVLRAQGHALADLRRAALRLVRREPRAAYGLECGRCPARGRVELAASHEVRERVLNRRPK